MYGYANDAGVFYGGSGRQLGMQVLGVLVIAAWACLLAGLLFLALKKVRREPEEHGQRRHLCAAAGVRASSGGGAALLLAAACLRPEELSDLQPTRLHARRTPPAPQLCWLRVPEQVELQGLDLAQGLSTGLVGRCFKK